MKILLLGHDGQVAWELRRTLACLGEVIAMGRSTDPGLDLADFSTLRATIQSVRPDLVVNAAAYTAVDRAEQEEAMANRINGEAVGVIAEEAQRVGAGLIHYSTDYVFPGDASQPYAENAVTGPLGVYGQSKLLGETHIRQVGLPHLIFRTAWVYGIRGQNFLLTMLRLMRERDELKVVDDQRGAPTWSRLIAEATALAVVRCDRDGRFEPRELSGTYHLTSGGETSWFGFASQIRGIAMANGLLEVSAARIEPIPTSAYPTPARRPAYSVLSNEKLARVFRLTLPDWETGLALCLADAASHR